MNVYRLLKLQWGEFSPALTYALQKVAFPLFQWAPAPKPHIYGWRENVSAMIIGGLYDVATPFTNAKEMRASFPASSLLTWQGVGHCLGGSSFRYNPDGFAVCTNAMIEYLDNGILPTDGLVCQATNLSYTATQTSKSEL